MVRLGLGGAAGFWVTNFAISLTPIAAEYRAALGITYLPMLGEALLGGLIIGFGVSYSLLHFYGRLPTSSPLVKAILLSLVALIVVTVLIEIPHGCSQPRTPTSATFSSAPPSTPSDSALSVWRSATCTAGPPDPHGHSKDSRVQEADDLTAGLRVPKPRQSPAASTSTRALTAATSPAVGSAQPTGHRRAAEPGMWVGLPSAAAGASIAVRRGWS